MTRYCQFSGARNCRSATLRGPRRRACLFALLAAGAVLAPAGGPARAQVEPPGRPPGIAAEPSRLADRQAAVREQIARLEDRLFQLAQALKKTEPEKASRLLEGLSALRGKQVRERMDGIVKLLGEAKFSDAVDQQQAVGNDLQELLKLLLAEPDNLEERKRELERLAALKQALEDVIREQEEEKRSAEQSARAQERAELLDAAARHLRDLIDRQKQLAESSRQGGDAGKAARDQAEVRGETESVARDVKSVAQAEEQAAENAGEKPQGASGAPEEQAPAAGPREGQHQAARAAGRLDQATKKMEQAEQKLRQAEGKEAAADQQQAADDLESALKDIEEQAREIRKRLKLEEQAAQQRATARKTEQLSNDMKGQGGDAASKGQGAPPGGESKPGESSEGESQQDDTPGAGQVQEAVPLQDEAADELDEEDPEKAAQKQQAALEKLKKAEEEVEDRLDQLRKEQQEELLAALESRFRAMLGRQLECNKSTTRLAELGAENWKRSDQLELAEVAQKQRWVGDQADEALFILTEEGSTVVLPQLIEQVRDDARLAADRLASADAGPTVRMIQDELEQVLRDIIDAVKKKQEELENSGGGGGEGGSQPLLPGSAELKLLRACQQRVNRMTVQIEEYRARPDASEKEVQSSLQQLQKRQGDVADMARTMHEALQRAQ